MVTVRPCSIYREFYAASPERQSRVTRCVSGSVRAPISRQSRKLASLGQCALWRQLAQTSLRKPRYRHRACLPGVSGWAFPVTRKRCYNLAVRETGVNPAVREDGEHFCELIGQEIIVQ